MPVEIAQAILNITPSMRGLQALIDREMRGADTRRAGRDAGDGYTGGFGESAKKLTGILAGAFAAVKIGDFAKDAIAQASDLNEAGSKLGVVFGDATDSVNAFASNGAKALGQSKLDVQNAAATFGVYGKAAGLAGQANADFSTKLVGLSTDLASFYNTDPAQATEAIAAGLRGESEPLRQYGILLDDASLRQEALSEGLISTTKNALTPQQRVLAAQNLIMKQSTVAQGDFARTSGGLANQQRILSAQFTDMKGKLGAAFLPAVTATVTALNEHLFPVLSDLGAKASAAWDVLRTGDFQGAASGLGEEDSPLVVGLLKAHDTYLTVENFLFDAWSLLRTGNFIGGSLGGAEEDSPLVGALLKARDLFRQIGPTLEIAWHTLMTGDNYGVSSDEQTPLVRIALMLRDFGLSTFDKLRGIWDTLWSVGEKLWPSLVSIGGSLAAAFQTLSGNGLTVWSVLLDVFQKIADSLNAWLVPALEWLARFMQENPASVLTFVGVILAVVGAVKAWTIAQGILDALLTANPIGLVVVALAAFAAAVVWAYNNVQWFHDLVDNVWTFIQNATKFMWENVLKPIFDTIVTNIHAMGDTYSWLWQTAQNVWGWIQDKISTVWGFIRDSIFAPLVSGISNVGAFFSGLWGTVQNVWQWIQDKISAVWLWLNQNVFAPLNLAIGTIGSFFNSLWTTVQTVWNNVSTFFVNVAKGIDDAVTKVKTGISDVKTAIDGFFERFQNWGGTQAGGTLGTINLNHHATGTVVPGYAPGVDNYPALLSPGEAVLVPQLTRQLGAANILAANSRAYAGGDGASMLRFAEGGVIGSAGSQAGELVAAQALKLLKSKQDEMKAAVDSATALGSSAVNLAEFTSSQDPSSFGWQRAAGIVPFNYGGMLTGVAGGTPGLWSALLAALAPSIPGGIKTLGGYENRANVNNPSMASFHSYGLAMDVNAPWNPNGVSGYGRSGQYVIPSGPAHALAAQFGMLWGGDFTGTPDPMHFEIHLPPSAIGGAIAGTLGAAVSSAVGFNPSAGVAQWHGVVLQALGLTGQAPGFASYVEHQMQTESSGNPRAINNWDSNAQRGDPSRGLMQTIMSTFNRYRLPNLSSDIYDPLSNIVASIRYVLARYGSIPAGMRGVAYANGGIVPGTGGIDSVHAFLTPGEGVLPKPQVDAYITHAKALEAGFSGAQPPVQIVLDSSDPLQVAIGRMMKQQINGTLVDLVDATDLAGMQSR